MNIAFLWTNQDRRRCACQNAVYLGLTRLGHTIHETLPVVPDNECLSECDAAFIWNGVHGRRRLAVESFRSAGKPAFVMERGFFDRYEYTQIDHVGFNHTASWALYLDKQAPTRGESRLKATQGDCVPVSSRQAGYILVLLQVANDSQLRSSEISHPGPLVRTVENASPEGIDIRVRAHPLSDWQCGTQHRGRMIGGSLDEAIDGARFVVTINSNAGNDALVEGCPVMCLGPALYAMAGAALQTSLADLPANIRKMLGGYCPSPEIVTNYLQHLACRQWSTSELAEGSVLADLLEAANASAS